jgi:hypothetical protein
MCLANALEMNLLNLEVGASSARAYYMWIDENQFLFLGSNQKVCLFLIAVDPSSKIWQF